MTAYKTWTIDGNSVPWVRSVQNDQKARTITLNCSAISSDGSEPRDEIATFEALTCDVITNTQLMNGGSVLQVCNGEAIILSDGHDSWVAALEKVVINENKVSDKRIDYDLVLQYETVGSGVNYGIVGSDDPDVPVDETNVPDSTDLAYKTYYPSWCGFSNITYYRYTDGTNDDPVGCGYRDWETRS